MTTITISLIGVPELRAKLERAAASLARPTELMQAIAAQMEVNVNARFDSKTDPAGKPWAPISPMTAKIYAITRGGERKPTSDDWRALRAGEVEPAQMPGSLLQRTRHLRDSLRADAFDNTAEVGFTRTVGKGWDLGMLHEFGTRTMPARRLLTADPKSGTLGPGDLDDISAVAGDYLDSLLG